MKKLVRIKKLKEYFDNGIIPRIKNHEVHPSLDTGSRENYLYFTLPVSINFQRNSPAMWKAAFATYQDPQTNYLFFPEEVFKKKRRDVQKSLIKHNLALQRNRHVDIWFAICKTLTISYNADPREVIKKGENTVSKILTIIQKSEKQNFPYLGGPKLSNYWLFILNHYTNIKLNDCENISIIPDTHVRQASDMLGVAKRNDKPDKIAYNWKKLLLDTGISPVDMHPVLWHWSRNKFQPPV